MVAAIVLTLIAGKYPAAEICGRAFGFAADRSLITPLTLPQVAATLATTLVGYQAVNAAGERLIEGGILNATLVLVVVTAVLGPLFTERAITRNRQRAPPLAAAVPQRS